MATTIKLEEETRDRLREFGHKGETYDEVVNRLLNLILSEKLAPKVRAT